MIRISTRLAAFVGTLLVLATVAFQPSLAQAPAATTRAVADARVGTIPANGGPISITPLVHASVQLEHAGKVILVDPWSVGDGSYLSVAKPADLILVTASGDHHGDLKAVQRLRKPGAPVIVAKEAKGRFPDSEVLLNGQTTTAAGIRVEAIGAYDITKLDVPGQPSHPKGEANGYLLTLGGKRVLFGGVTECVPELRALKNIDLYFLTINMPLGRMPPSEGAECAKAIGAKVVYPYHFDNASSSRIEDPKSTQYPYGEIATNRAGVEALKKMLAADGIEVRIGAFYPGWPAKAGQ